MTLHAAKGLEFPVVFIVGLEQGLLPHSRANENEAELEEERRLLFVGITRPERELYLSHCRVREFRGQRLATIPSCFLARAARGADDRPRPVGVRVRRHDPAAGIGRSPAAASPSESRPGRRREFRLTTAAELAGAAPAGPGRRTSTPSGPASRCVHPQYGIGRIVAIDGAGPNRKGRVAFTVGGERTFILAKSPLRPVGGGEPDPPARGGRGPSGSGTMIA